MQFLKSFTFGCFRHTSSSPWCHCEWHLLLFPSIAAATDGVGSFRVAHYGCNAAPYSLKELLSSYHSGYPTSLKPVHWSAETFNNECNLAFSFRFGMTIHRFSRLFLTDAALLELLWKCLVLLLSVPFRPSLVNLLWCLMMFCRRWLPLPGCGAWRPPPVLRHRQLQLRAVGPLRGSPIWFHHTWNQFLPKIGTVLSLSISGWIL